MGTPPLRRRRAPLLFLMTFNLLLPLPSAWNVNKPICRSPSLHGRKKGGLFEASSSVSPPPPQQQALRGESSPEANEMWPPLPAGTPITPLPKELLRQKKLVAGPPGVPMSTVKAKTLRSMHLDAFHPVNLEYPGLRLVHLDPPVFVVEDFLTPGECDELIALSEDTSGENAHQVDSPTFMAGLGAARTSTTWFLRYGAAAALVKKISALLADVNPTHFEEPQLVRYEPGQLFKWHLDEVPPSQLSNGGQRLATTLVYLNDLTDDFQGAGATAFRELGVNVSPRRGMALLFFPAFAADGVIGSAEEAGNEEGAASSSESQTRSPLANKPGKAKKGKKGKRGAAAETPAPTVPLRFKAGQGDERTLHAGGAPVLSTKWIAQIWTHASRYEPTVPKGNRHLEDL